MLKNRYRVVVQTVSNNAVRKIVEKNNLTQYINNKVALWQLNPQLATPEEIKNINPNQLISKVESLKEQMINIKKNISNIINTCSIFFSS